MQRTLLSTRQPGSRASSSTSSSSSLQSTRQLSSSISRLRQSTASSPLLINDDTESGDHNNPSSASISRKPPPADQNYGYIFPIDWDNLYLQKHSKLTGKYGYRVLHKQLISGKASISPIWQHGADLFWDGPMGIKRLWLYRICHLAQKPSSLLTINGNNHIIGHLRSKHNINVGPRSYKSNTQSPIPLSPFKAAA